jgi:hypothetical protein
MHRIVSDERPVRPRRVRPGGFDRSAIKRGSLPAGHAYPLAGLPEDKTPPRRDP